MGYDRRAFLEKSDEDRKRILELLEDRTGNYYNPEMAQTFHKTLDSLKVLDLFQQGTYGEKKLGEGKYTIADVARQAGNLQNITESIQAIEKDSDFDEKIIALKEITGVDINDYIGSAGIKTSFLGGEKHVGYKNYLNAIESQKKKIMASNIPLDERKRMREEISNIVEGFHSYREVSTGMGVERSIREINPQFRQYVSQLTYGQQHEDYLKDMMPDSNILDEDDVYNTWIEYYNRDNPHAQIIR